MTRSLTLRTEKHLNLSNKTWSRIRFLQGLTGAVDEESIVTWAVHLYDAAVGSCVLESSELRIHHIDGTTDRLIPEGVRR